ncbi:MAG: 3-methyl-2-oxobutanoate hydroxymethyltransferase, partial [Candidatus Kryptoniota bacterium]
QDAGCFSLVLESVPGQLASFISQHLDIPTIGIGAGPGCDGQVLVTHDLLGLFERFRPRFVKQYVNLNQIIKNAISQYCQDVQNHNFPALEHTIEMNAAEWDAFLELTQPMKFNPVAEVSMK